MVKRFAAVLASAFMLLYCIIPCYAVNVDGIPKNSEWLESTIYSFENPDGFNNDVTFAYIRVIPKGESNQLFLCVSMRVEDISSPENSAVVLCLNGGDETVLKGTENSAYDKNLYNIEYAMAYDAGAKNIVYEVMYGVKYGIPVSSQLSVRLCDCEGVPSNEFTFDLEVVGGITDEQDGNDDQQTAFESTKTSSSKNKGEKTNSVTTQKSNKNSSGKTKTNKNSGKTDDFTFNKVKATGSGQEVSQIKEDETTSTVNLTQQLEDNSSVRKKVITVVGVVCAMAIAGGAVYSGVKKASKKEDK